MLSSGRRAISTAPLPRDLINDVTVWCTDALLDELWLRFVPQSEPAMRIIRKAEYIVEQIVRLGADINGCDTYRWPALFHAVQLRTPQLVACYLRLGADPTFVSDDGMTAEKVAREVLAPSGISDLLRNA